jgi:hypothetical protein
MYLLTAIGLTPGGISTDLIIKNWVLSVGRLDGLHGMFNIRTCIVSSTNKCSQKVQENTNRKIPFMPSIKLLHVSAPEFHPQGLTSLGRKIRTRSSAGLILSTSKMLWCCRQGLISEKLGNLSYRRCLTRPAVQLIPSEVFILSPCIF